MAINFPDSPSNGDTYTANGKTFVYNSTNTSWRPQTAAESGGTDVLADMAALIAKTGMSNGDQALVQSTNNLYMYSGSGWYKIATIQNDAPSAITGVDGSYALATDGAATTITAVSTDPEGFALTWSYTSSGLGSIATVSQADNVFTVTPSTDAANAGSFTLTISATDGINGAVSTVPSFTLAFIVQNSRYTALSVKATNTGSNQTFDDASTSNHTITANGDTTASTFSPHRHDGYSTYLGTQTSRYYSPSSSDFDIGGTGNWSYEAWVYADTQTFPSYTRGFGLGPFYNDPKSFGIQLSDANASNNITVYWDDDGAGLGRKLTSSTAFSQEVWHHLLVCRSGNDIALFLDGTRIAHNNSYTSSIDSGNTYLFVGHTGFGTEGFMGHIRDVRFINGSHPYDASASSITVPTEPLTAITNTKFLLGDLPYFKDQSASNHAITFDGDVSLKLKSVFDNSPYSESSHGASAYFDGTGDYLSLSASNDFDVSDGDITIECWVYRSAADTTKQCVWEFYADDNNLLRLFYEGNNKYSLLQRVSGTNNFNVSISGTTSLNEWEHLAVTRSSSGTYKLYINGVENISQSEGVTINTSGMGFYIGADLYNTDRFWNGYISDFRIVKGSLVYSSNFTPPTAPLTVVTNTKFLLNPETSISDLSQKSEIQCFGDAATSTTQVKFSGTKSIYLDGTGDYIQINNIEDSWISGYTGDFTIEFWWYPTNVSVYQAILTAAAAFQLYTNNSTLNLALSSTNSYSPFWHPQSMHTMVNNTWHHIAIVRNGNIYAVYVDGVSKATTTTSTLINTGTNVPQLGIYTGNSSPSQGYFQDFRITKGLARYTSNFTPPTAELEG